MRRYFSAGPGRAGLGVRGLLVTIVAGGLTMGIVATAPSAGAATVVMGTTSGGQVTPVAGTTGALHNGNVATDFPDPSITYSGIGNTYYAYSTGTSFPVYADWTTGGIGVTTLSCTTSGCTDQSDRSVARSHSGTPPSLDAIFGLQAPTVAYLGGQWVMYYAGVYAPAGTGAYAVYNAISSSPTSGFGTLRATEAPVVAQTATGGSTDPAIFISPAGQPWLTWKSSTYYHDTKPAHLWSMRLTTYGTALKPGTVAHVLVTQPTSGWASATIENPQMVWSGGTYYLFYSGGSWNSTGYAEGYTTCAGPTGGCGTPSTHEILSGPTSVPYGPGGGSLFTTTTGTWLMAFHGWNTSCTTYGPPCNGYRDLYVRPVANLFPTSLPSITRFTPSTSGLPSTGGHVTLNVTMVRSAEVSFTASPSVAGLPGPQHTTATNYQFGVTLPANTGSAPVVYTFTATAAGPYGGQAIKTMTVSVAAVGSIPAPTVVTANNELGPVIQWSAVAGATTYEILRNGVPLTSTTSTSFRDVTASPEQVYNYQVQAKNSHGVLLATSGSVNLKYNPIFTDSFHGSAEGIYRYQNQLITVYLGSGGVLDEDTWDPTYGGWYSAKLPNALAAQSAPAVTTYQDGSLQVVYVGPTEVLYHDFYNPSTNKWTNEAVPNAKKVTEGSPVVTTYADRSLQIVYVGPTGVLYHDFFNPTLPTNLTHWTNEAVPGALKVTMGSPAITTYSNGSLQIVYVGPTGVLYHDFWTPVTTRTGPHWANEAVPHAAKVTTGSPAVTTYTNKSLQIVYVGPTGVLYHDFFNPTLPTNVTHWTNEAVPHAAKVTAGSPAVTTYTKYNSLQIVYVGPTGVLYHDFFNPTLPTNVTHWTNEAVPGAQKAQGSPAIANYINGSLQILYDTTTNQLHHDFWTPTTTPTVHPHWADEKVPLSTPVS